MSSEAGLCFVSWNTNGIKTKLSDVLNILDELRTEIAFIQETHVGPDDNFMLEMIKDKWRAYFTVHSPQSKGVAILIKEDADFEYICHDEDHSGGYIVLFCRLYGELYTLVSVYNHKDDKHVLVRLKEYLQETAEGVLVVGGDFNTVLEPSLDRKSNTQSQYRNDPLRHNLEVFTSSLKLTDTWAHLHPTDLEFTRTQGDGSSSSRLDMFFMPEDTLKRVTDCRIEPKYISDHDPVVLTLKRVQQPPIKRKSYVALMLEDFSYNRIQNRRSGEISGAEILTAIKCFNNSGEKRPDDFLLDFYKRNRCPLTEVLKIMYNHILKTKQFSLMFSDSYCSESRCIFSADYLIFVQILAERLMFLIPSFKQEMKAGLDNCIILTFAEDPKKIKWSFLENSLAGLWDPHLAPPPNASILKRLLPKDTDSEEFVCLQQGCPLRRPILTLALKQLEKQLSENHYKTSFCKFRQTFVINPGNDRLEEVKILANNFFDKSGIRLKEKQIPSSIT